MGMLLQYSSVLTWNTEIPGIKFTTEELPLPLMKVYGLKGYWAKLNSNLEYIKYTKPHLHYHNSVVRREWHNLISEERTGKRRSTMYVRNILENAMKVIASMETRTLEPRLIPFLQEEDRHQRLLMGLVSTLCTRSLGSTASLCTAFCTTLITECCCLLRPRSRGL